MEYLHTDYDVVIIGSGPAGGICAYELATTGMRVVLLEKERLPRYKVCAGGLTKKAVEILPEELGEIVENRTSTLHLTLNHKGRISKTVSFPVVTMVMRDNFDFFLIQKSEERGAFISDRTEVLSVEEFPDYVLVRTNDGVFSSQVVVGADGVKSRVARNLSLRKNPKLGVAIEGEIFPSRENGCLSEYFGCLHLDFNVIPRGYGWIFPKRDHLSVGVFTTLPKIKGIKNYFYDYLDRKGLGDGYDCRTLIGHQIPIGGWGEVLNTKRGLVVGDAAGLADPITGEGIYFALRSGQIAAKVIGTSDLGADFSLDRYTKKIKSEISDELVYARYLAMAIYNLPSLAFGLARRREKLLEAGIKVAIGDLSYRDALKKVPRKLYGLIYS